ncbi:MAG: HEAT repeat domain-containing protein [Polyangiaceae bacterium]
MRHASPAVRRAAARALGSSVAEDAREPALSALREAASTEGDGRARASMIEALAKIGGARVASELDELYPTPSGAGARSAGVERARLAAKRDAIRETPSSLREDATLDRADVVYRCRRGLESILTEELRARGLSDARPEGPSGLVRATYSGPFGAVLEARTALSVAFPLAPLDPSLEDAPALVRALTAPASLSLVTHLTHGPARFRLELPRGKRRALVWEVAASLDGAPIVNDPRASTWVATVRELGRGARVEWSPRLPDERFAYRVADVPAASHPTLAAALVRVSEPRGDDVVWDPFIGSGLELCERHLFGSCRALIGTDVDDAALDRSRSNLASVGAIADLFRATAMAFRPDTPLSVILTNPPMGRRVLEGHDIAGMLGAFVRRAPEVLGPRGRLVWLSPVPGATREAARAAGLRLTRSSDVDMGGFSAELQRFDLP